MGKMAVKHKIVLGVTFLSLLMVAGLAEATTSQTIGSVAASITGTFANIGKLITAASYIAGLGFSIAAVLKFKAHKDNPQQTPVGQPIGLVVVAAGLLFLPNVMTSVGATLFTDAKTAGAGGTSI